MLSTIRAGESCRDPFSEPLLRRTVAGPASPTAMRRHQRVGLVVRMSVRAVSLETVLDGGMVWASVHVLAVRDSLKMVRIRTTTVQAGRVARAGRIRVVTQMIDLFAVGDRLDQCSVDEPVDVVAHPVDLATNVAGCLLRSAFVEPAGSQLWP